MIVPTPLPSPCWVELRMPSGKLVAKFDPKRGILEVVDRCERELFDLAQLVQEHREQHPPPRPPDHPTELTRAPRAPLTRAS